MAAKKKRVKVTAANQWIAQSRADVNDAIARLGDLQRERIRIETLMNDEISLVKQAHEAVAQQNVNEIQELVHAIHVFCEAHRAELTEDGKRKTAVFATGEVRWRKDPPSVVLKSIDDVLKALKSLGLPQFIRSKEEVDKEAILKTPAVVEGVKGITIKQAETFSIVPLETSLEAVAS